MAEKIYLDFDLQIEQATQGYRVEVNGPGGQATGNFSLPFSDLELENFLLKIGQTRRTMRRVDAPEVTAAKALGKQLFDAIFADDLRACLRSSLDEASRQDAGLRIRLRLTDAPELADLPWEYLYHSALNRFLALSTETPLVRYLELPERIRPLAVTPPLRMLVMISSPRGYPPLDVEREWSKLQTALGDLAGRGLVVLERIPATLAALQHQLRRNTYHIVHFIGHGGFDERTQDGVLLLEDEEGESDRVSGQDLGTLLHDHRTLRLVMLNACEGARGSRADPFAGTAQSLVQQGLPAVIAMQFEVSDEAAITLAHEFYSAIADSYPVDAALAEARKALFAAGNRVEWGTPVLYLRAPDGKIFDVAPAAPVAVPPSAPVDDEPPRPVFVSAVARARRRGQPWSIIVGVAVGTLVLVSVGVVIGVFGPQRINRSTPTQLAREATSVQVVAPATVPSMTQTQTQVVPTAAPIMPTAAPPAPAQTIGAFYTAINDRSFDAAWGLLSRRYKDDPARGPTNGPMTAQENYSLSWSSIEKVMVQNVEMLTQSNADADLRVTLRFVKTTGTDVTVDLHLTLIFDNAKNTWLIDSIAPADDIPYGECRITVYGLYLHKQAAIDALQLMPTGTGIVPLAQHSTPDRLWLKVRLADGLVGWVTYNERWITCREVDIFGLPQE